MNNRIFVADALAHTLPFKERLSWEEFQLLCTDILKSDARFADARDFLKQGNAQEGIDIYAIPHDASKRSVAQCKLEQYISPKKLHQIVDTFLSGSFATSAGEFILCTNFDFKTERAEQAVEGVRTKLKAKGVNFVLWDKSGLEAELRVKPRPQIIARYFGTEIASAFYGQTFSEWIAKYQVVCKQIYSHNPNYIARTLTAQGDIKERQLQFFWTGEKSKTLPELFAPTLEANGKKIVMLSTAGFGKTWEADELAAHYADAKELLYPIKTYLADYEGQSIETLLSQLQPDWQRIPKETLLLVLDGLDDIKSTHVQTFANYLNLFAESNPTVNVFVSSRFNFYDLEYPLLRNFSVYVLDEFTEKDISEYIAKNLPSEEVQFRQRLDTARFSEYAGNPYYLTRLVRFYKNKTARFPENKVALFERILFEGFEADKHKYRIELSKTAFRAMAEKVAFSMTMRGKNGLNADELEAIIPDVASRRDFQRLFLFTRGVTEETVWTFEHKNLQEYLCASAFQNVPFSRVRQLVSFKHTPDKLQPWFLNTISFLFSAASEPLFDALFRWLSDSQPELLVRFEKDRIPKATRFEILKRILDYYGNRDLSLYSSSNFSVDELADFVDIDTQVIDYLEQKLFDNSTSNWLAYDIITLLSACRSAHVYRKRLTEIILEAMPTRKDFNRFSASCIRALIELNFFDKETAESILNSGIDFENFETRSATVSYLANAKLTENYIDFVLSSIAIYEEGQKKISHYGVNEQLRTIIAGLKSAYGIKSVFRRIIVDPEIISDGYSTGKVYLSAGEVAALLTNAQNIYKSDKSVLPLVYRIFNKIPHLAYDAELATVFKTFFENTCGNFCMFQKLFRYDRNGRDLMLFVDEQGCQFLLESYDAGEISDTMMGQLRNRLSHGNWQLFLKFQATLDSKFGDRFKIEEFGFDYAKQKQMYIRKNQEMLLDRDEFFKEADRIFAVVGKPTITRNDLWSFDDRELMKFQSSLVMKKLQRWSGNVAKSKDDLIGSLKKDENWEGFKINSVKNMLEHRKESEPIDARLIEFAKKWCLHRLETLDYANAVTETETGEISCNNYVLFTNELFRLLDIESTDELLLKILLTDFYGGMNRSDLGLSGIVAEKVLDKTLLRTTILKSIEGGLPNCILKTHFALCHHLHYTECLPKLYETIIGNVHLTSYDQNRLTDYYFDLGGKVHDFEEHLAIPTNVEHYRSWNWHLIEKAKDSNPELAKPTLLGVLSAPEQPEMNKIHACRLLMQLGEIRALQYWRDFILAKQVTPFDHNQDVIIQHAPDMPASEVVPILMEVLEFTYVHNLHETLRFPDSIEDAVYAILYAVAMKNVTNLKAVTEALSEIYSRYSSAAFARHIEFHRERISQNFYKRQNQEITIADALEAYTQLIAPIEKSTKKHSLTWVTKNREWLIDAIVAFIIFLLSIVAHRNGLL